MQYMLMIYQDENQRTKASKEDMAKMFEAYGKVTKAMQDAGVMRAGSAMHPSTSATTVRVRGASPTLTDGPALAGGRDQLSGYYLLECKNLDDALSWAAKIPGARIGAVEVRPLMEM